MEFEPQQQTKDRSRKRQELTLFHGRKVREGTQAICILILDGTRPRKTSKSAGGTTVELIALVAISVLGRRERATRHESIYAASRGHPNMTNLLLSTSTPRMQTRKKRVFSTDVSLPLTMV